MQGRKRVVYLILLTILLSGLTSGADYWFDQDHDPPDEIGVEYENQVKIEVLCEPADDCVEHVRFNVCDESIATLSSESPHDPYRKYSDTLKVPNEAPCSQGWHDLNVVDQATGDTLLRGSLFVHAKGDFVYPGPHVGQWLIVGMNQNKDNMADFFLTNDHITNAPPNSGRIRLLEYDYSNDWGSAGIEYGEKIDLQTDNLREITSGCDGNGDSCQILDENFGRHYDRNYHNSDLKDTNTISPVHDDGHYFAEGEIIKAHYPRHYDSNGDQISGNSPFFICREGATIDNGYGNTVPQVVDINQPGEDTESDLRKCDTSTGQWEQTWECDDGLDNDGDESIDLDDTSCNGDYRNKDESSAGCKPNIVWTNDGWFYARYGGDAVGDGTKACDGSNGDAQKLIDWSDYGNDPSTFTCDNNNINSEFCSSSKRAYNSHDEHAFRGSQITGVQYYPTEEYLEAVLGSQGTHSLDSSLNSFDKKMIQRFVNREGWKAPKMAVDTGSWGVENPDQLYGSGNPHDENYWLGPTGEGGKGMISPEDGYEEYSYKDSWIVSNPGNNHDSISDPRFPGGFAGKCDTGQTWQFIDRDDEWRCSGQPNWQQAVLLPEMTWSGDNGEIGMVIVPYNWKPAFDSMDSSGMETSRSSLREFEPNIDSWEGAFERHHSLDASYTDRDYSLDSVDVTCHPNQDSFTPDFSDRSQEGITYFNETVEIQQDWKKPLAVYGELTLKSNSTYRCEWQYNLAGDFSDVEEVNNPLVEAGNVIALHEQMTFSPEEPYNLLEYYMDGKEDEEFDGYGGFQQSYGYGGFSDKAEEYMKTHNDG